MNVQFGRSRISNFALLLLICILAFGSFILPAAGPLPPPPPTKERRLIDALANRNNPPPLLLWRKGPERIPLFHANYDWEEQERVVAALKKAASECTPELWEELWRSGGDKRYCLTVAYHPPAESGEALGNYSVGWFCGRIAFDQAHWVYDRYLPHDLGLPPFFKLLDAAEANPEAVPVRQKPKDETLLEHQIALCTWVLAILPKAKLRFSRLTREEAMEEIRKELKDLEETRRPVIPVTDPLFDLMLYDRDTAEKCRRMSRSKE
jgi:hypothetical protein